MGVSMDVVQVGRDYAVGWGTLALINADPPVPKAQK
jgi:hypothetical protein